MVELAGNVFGHPEHRWELKVLNDSTLLGQNMDCYFYKYVVKSGIIDPNIHQCIVKVQTESWIEGLGLEGELISYDEKNMNNCNGICDIIYKIKW